MAELQETQMTRRDLEACITSGDLEKLVVGFHARIRVIKNNGDLVYRVGEITGVTEISQSYMLGNTTTKQVLKLKVGAGDYVVRMDFISDEAFTYSEFWNWKEGTDMEEDLCELFAGLTIDESIYDF